MLLTLFVLCTLLVPSLAYAAPTISNVSGTLTNGTTITITGSHLYDSGTGDKPTAAPLISSYDHPTAANNWHGKSSLVTGGWTAPQGQPRVGSGSGRTALYQSDIYANCSYDDANSHYGGEDYFYVDYPGASTSITTFYTSSWWYVTAATFPTSAGGSNSKNIRWFPNAYSSSWMMEFMCYNDGSSCDVYNTPGVGTYMAATDGTSGNPGDTTYIDPSVVPVRTWHHMETWIQGGWSSGSLATVYVIIDGHPSAPETQWYFDQTHNNNEWRFGVVSGSNTAGGSIYFDQVYVDSGPAHVFVSNKGDITNWLTYSSTAHTEVQVPQTWTHTSITFPLNQGTCTNFTSDCKYLYVVDSAGVISSAYDLSAGSSDTTAPTVTFTTTSPQTIVTDSLAISGTAYDAVWGTGSSCKWRLTSAPDATHGTAITGLTYSGTLNWSTTASGFSKGANTLYVGCGDAVPNWTSPGTSITVNYNPQVTGAAVTGVRIQ